jgi:hypothetical protein
MCECGAAHVFIARLPFVQLPAEVKDIVLALEASMNKSVMQPAEDAAVSAMITPGGFLKPSMMHMDAAPPTAPLSSERNLLGEFLMPSVLKPRSVQHADEDSDMMEQQHSAAAMPLASLLQTPTVPASSKKRAFARPPIPSSRQRANKKMVIDQPDEDADMGFVQLAPAPIGSMHTTIMGIPKPAEASFVCPPQPPRVQVPQSQVPKPPASIGSLSPQTPQSPAPFTPKDQPIEYDWILR